MTWTILDWGLLKIIDKFQEIQNHSSLFLANNDNLKQTITNCRVSQCRRCSKAEGWRSPWTAAARYTAALSDDPDGAHRHAQGLGHSIHPSDNKYGFHLPEEKLEFECFYSHIGKLCTSQPQQPILRKISTDWYSFFSLFLMNAPGFA